MITIIYNTPRKITFKKSDSKEPWFDHDCSNERLLKECGREGDKIRRVQWDDDGQIANLLHVYFEEQESEADKQDREDSQHTLLPSFSLFNKRTVEIYNRIDEAKRRKAR